MDSNTPTPPPTDRSSSSLGLLIVVWLVVGVPALWGVSKTIQTSLNLFNPPAATTTQPTRAPTGPLTSPSTSPSTSQP